MYSRCDVNPDSSLLPVAKRIKFGFTATHRQGHLPRAGSKLPGAHFSASGLPGHPCPRPTSVASGQRPARAGWCRQGAAARGGAWWAHRADCAWSAAPGGPVRHSQRRATIARALLMRVVFRVHMPARYRRYGVGVAPYGQSHGHVGQRSETTVGPGTFAAGRTGIDLLQLQTCEIAMPGHAGQLPGVNFAS